VVQPSQRRRRGENARVLAVHISRKTGSQLWPKLSHPALPGKHMMNDEQLDDLMQFIDARISQSEQRMSAGFKEQLQITNQKIDDGLAGVGEAIEQINNRLDKRDQEVDQRLTKLERQIAA
jgi:hypothetical protein